MAVTVNGLLAEPFLSRSKEERLNILLGGKPRPKNFKAELFEKEQWLTGCEVRNAYYCWPCLLFVTEPSTAWNSYGCSYYDRLFRVYDKHKSTQSHISGVLKLQMFLNENLVKVTGPTTEISGPVKKNRAVVKRIVDVVCHIATVKTPISNGENICDQHIVEDCIEYLSLLKTYGSRNTSDEAINLIMASPNVLRDIVSTLSRLVALEVKNEVQTSTYVSFILSEHSEIDLKAKLSNVLRYIKDGKVHERFIGFNHCIAYKSSSLIENHILEILAKFEIEKKLLALSCDGSVMSMRHLQTVIRLFRSKFPGFQFVPCYYHDFDFVLEQSLSVIQECRLFFQNLRSIKYYIQGSCKISQQVNSFMSDNIPNLCDFKLSDSHFLRVLKLHRLEFIRFFTGIEQNFEEYSEDDVANASGFITMLTEKQTIFLLETFYVLFGHTAIFSETLSSCYPENVFEKGVIENIELTLLDKREDCFLGIWSLTKTETSGVSEKPTASAEQSTISSYFRLFYKIMDTLVTEMSVRLRHLDKLNFFHILNFECHGKFGGFHDHVRNLVETYKTCIDETMLRKELDIINSNNSVLARNSVYQFLETLVSMNLQDIFKNVVNLAEIILSMPCKPLCSTGNISKFDTIKAWSTVCGNGDILDDLSILSIEKDILQHAVSQEKFCDEFMSLFQKLNGSLQVTENHTAIVPTDSNAVENN